MGDLRKGQTHMLPISFVEAASRHLRDAYLLFEAGRHDNSLYLAGYVVECSLKAVAGWTGLSPERYGHQLVKLEGDGLDLAMVIAPAAARYRPPAASVRAVSSSWSPDRRYLADGVSVQLAGSIISEAETIWRSCVGEMFLDGLIQELP